MLAYTPVLRQFELRDKHTEFSSLVDQSKFKEYCGKSGIPLFAWSVTWIYASSPFKSSSKKESRNLKDFLCIEVYSKSKQNQGNLSRVFNPILKGL